MCFVPLVHQHCVMDEDVVSKQHKHIQFQLFPVLLLWNEDVTDKFIKIGSLSILFLSSVSQRETDSVCVALCALLLSSSTVSLKMTSFFFFTVDSFIVCLGSMAFKWDSRLQVEMTWTYTVHVYSYQLSQNHQKVSLGFDYYCISKYHILVDCTVCENMDAWFLVLVFYV